MIYLATDHAGYNLTQEIIVYFKGLNLPFEFVGALSYNPVDSYVQYTNVASEKVVQQKNNIGIFLCGTGIGTSIVANRHKHIRAALCHNIEFASLARKHNDANVLVLPARYLNISTAKDIIKTFLSTKFEGGRHAERVDNIESDNYSNMNK